MHHSIGGNAVIHFSTLESHHRDPSGDKFLLYSYELHSGMMQSRVVAGSPEARSYAYSEATGQYVLGTSVDPQILLFDPINGNVKTVFAGPKSNAFIHSLAVRDAFAYVILSTPDSPVRGFDGIVKVNLQNGETKVIPYSEPMQQGWGGVQTIDPTGRIWFYRAYPLRLMWFDASSGMRDRTWPEFEGWSVESWDSWNGKDYLLLTNDHHQFVKKPVRLDTLESLPVDEDSSGPDSSLFMKLLRVDLYHTENVVAGALYFDPETSTFYRRDSNKDSFVVLGRNNLGRFEITGFHHSPQERSTRWIHPRYGEVEVLGLLPNGFLAIWLRGRKTYGEANLTNGSLILHDLKAPSISPAEITSLVAWNGECLYGGGILTMSHIFKFNPVTHQSQLLEEVIPNAEGQINSMFVGWDGMIYGAGYPDSVLFKFDPVVPWNPGRLATSNPMNLGPMGHHRQMRASKGVQDLDGNVWYQSVTDYDFPVAHALAKANFDTRSLVVKTDLDDGIPAVDDLAVFDAGHVILLGSLGGRHGLYLLNQRDYRIETSLELSDRGGVVANLEPKSTVSRKLFLAQGQNVYRINADLSLEHLHSSVSLISKILSRTEEAILLIGKDHIEELNLITGTSKVWWNNTIWNTAKYRGKKPGGYVFRQLSWLPVVYEMGALFFADGDKIWKFDPPEL